MTIPFDDIRVRQGRTLDEFEAPLLDVIGASAQQALYDNPIQQVGRLLEEKDLNGNEQVFQGFVQGKGYAPAEANYASVPRKKLDAETAQQRLKDAGVTYAIPAEGITEDWLNTLIKRRQERAARDDIIKRAPSGSLPLQIAASLGASVLDPVNVATAFIPVVGPARYARMLEQAGSFIGRTGVRAGIGALEGAVGQAVLEPLNVYANSQEGIDYSMADSLRNIAFGGLLGGGLHTVGGAVADALSRKAARGETDIPDIPKDKSEPGSAAAIAERMPPQVSDSTFQAVIAQAVSGRNINVESLGNIAEIATSIADAEAIPGFLRTAEQKITLERTARTPEIEEAVRNFSTPEFLKTAEDKIFQRALERGEVDARVSETNRIENVTRQVEGMTPEQLIQHVAEKRAEQDTRLKLIGDDARLRVVAKENNIPVETLKENLQRQVKDSEKDLKSYSDMLPKYSQLEKGVQLDGVYKDAEVAQKPEAAQGVDFSASEQADSLLNEAPKTEDLTTVMEAASLAEQDLKELADQLGMDSVKLSESINEDVKRADSYAKAAKAAAVCNLRN